MDSSRWIQEIWIDKEGETIANLVAPEDLVVHLHWELGTAWTGGLLTGKMDPLSVYGVQDPFSSTGLTSVETFCCSCTTDHGITKWCNCCSCKCSSTSTTESICNVSWWWK